MKYRRIFHIRKIFKIDTKSVDFHKIHDLRYNS